MGGGTTDERRWAQMGEFGVRMACLSEINHEGTNFAKGDGEVGQGLANQSDQSDRTDLLGLGGIGSPPGGAPRSRGKPPTGSHGWAGARGGVRSPPGGVPVSGETSQVRGARA